MSSSVLASMVAVSPRVDVGARAALAATLEADPPPGILLVTCHRVELHATRPVLDGLGTAIPDHADMLTMGDTALHLIRVALGLESTVLAEDQVLHQLRSAVARARARHALHPDLDRLADLALAAGRRARSWRPAGARSLADVALDAVAAATADSAGARTVPAGNARAGYAAATWSDGGEGHRPSPDASHRPSPGASGRLRILVVGTGPMGRLATNGAAARGWDVTIAGRTPARARALAREFHAASAPFDPGEVLRSFDAVVVALRGPWVLAPRSLDALDAGRSSVVDLSMPRAIPHLPRHEAARRVVDVDALVATEPADHEPSLKPRLEQLAADTMGAFERWQAGSSTRDAAAALAARADADRARALDRLWSRLPGLDPDERAAIEAMTRHLAGDLLREPLSRLTRDRSHEAAARELFGL